MLQSSPQQRTIDTMLVLQVFWGYIGFNLEWDLVSITLIEWDLVSITKTSTALASPYVKQDMIIVTHEWYEA